MERDGGRGPLAEPVRPDQPVRMGRTGGPTGRRAGGFDLLGWFAAPRRAGVPGVYALGPAPRRTEADEEAGQRIPGWKLLLRALLNLVVAYELFHYLRGPLAWLAASFTPSAASGSIVTEVLLDVFYYGVFGGLLLWFFGRLGRWPLVWRRYVRPALARLVTREEPDAEQAETKLPTQHAAPPPDPWRELRAAAPADALTPLDADTATGRATDVDHARLHRAWRSVSADHARLSGFLHELRTAGSAACAHPSGARDLPLKTAQHDLLTGQLRLGTAVDAPRNPAPYRGVHAALDPGLLGGSLLAVGPAGSGKTTRLARPVAESLCLLALTGQAVTVVVGSDEADLGPDEWYDVVVAPGQPRGRYGLDLYGAALGDDEAADRLADALLPEELALRGESARSTLRAVLPPFRAGYGRAPGVRELSAVLRGEPDAWVALRDALRTAGRLEGFRRHLDHRERLHGRADDLGGLLADRLALLDRPEFADSLNPSADEPSPGGAARPSLPLFALRALDHPLRVRIALPERTHPEASRILSRLAVGQFVHAAGARADRSLFAGLVVDDATAAIDTHVVRGLQRMRGANAGAVMLLRSLADLPETLRTPLFGAVGCRMAFPGLAPWDGRLFSEVWGTEWVQERDITLAPDTSGGLLRRTLRGTRALLAGEQAQTESVTTRRVERQRWSPSDLAHGLPGGHAVLSLTAPDGTAVPPLLVDLRA